MDGKKITNQEVLPAHQSGIKVEKDDMDSYSQRRTREETTRTLVRYSKVTNRHDL